MDNNIVMNPCPKFVDNNSIPRTQDLEQNMEPETPLPTYSQQKPSSSIVAPHAIHPRACLTLDEAIEYELKHDPKLDPNMDTKKLRRTISNRLSAQRSRIKKVKHIDDMEKMVKDLQELISILTPQVESCQQQYNQLTQQNDSLRKLAEIRFNESKLADVEVEKKKAEIARLKELEKKMKNKIIRYDPNSGEEQGLRLKQITPSHPYMKLQYLDKFESPKQTAPTFGIQEAAGRDEQLLGFTIYKIPVVEVLPTTRPTNQEEAETDQYLNFEALNVDPAS